MVLEVKIKMGQYNHELIMLLFLYQALQVVLAIKNLHANTRDEGDLGLISGVRKNPWNRKWQPAQVFLPGESHGQRSLMCYSP